MACEEKYVGTCMTANIRGVQYTANLEVRKEGDKREVFHFYFFVPRYPSGGVTVNVPRLMQLHLANQFYENGDMINEKVFDYVFDSSGVPYVRADIDFNELEEKSELISKFLVNNNLPEDIASNPVTQALKSGRGLDCLKMFSE